MTCGSANRESVDEFVPADGTTTTLSSPPNPNKLFFFPSNPLSAFLHIVTVRVQGLWMIKFRKNVCFQSTTSVSAGTVLLTFRLTKIGSGSGSGNWPSCGGPRTKNKRSSFVSGDASMKNCRNNSNQLFGMQVRYRWQRGMDRANYSTEGLSSLYHGHHLSESR